VLARYAGVPRSRIDAVLDAVELRDRAGDRFATYSLGMKQWLGVAAALLGDPELLVRGVPGDDGTEGRLTMIASVSAELLKLRKRPATWVLAGVWLALLTTFGFLLPYLGYLTGDTGGPPVGPIAGTLPANLVSNAIAGSALFGGALVMILGALIAGSEHGWGTIKTVLTQGPRRASVYAGSLAALAAILLGLVLVSFALSAAASAVIAGAVHARRDVA
jgi:ABC-2 type transport system permease protein